MWFFGPRVEAIKADEINNQLLKKYQLLDVRTPAEFKSGHIRGAVNHPLAQIQLFQGSKRQAYFSDLPKWYEKSSSSQSFIEKRVSSEKC